MLCCDERVHVHVNNEDKRFVSAKIGNSFVGIIPRYRYSIDISSWNIYDGYRRFIYEKNYDSSEEYIP